MKVRTNLKAGSVEGDGPTRRYVTRKLDEARVEIGWLMLARCTAPANEERLP
jgi:hypothetical protein